MKVTDFEGNTYNFPPGGKQIANNDRRPRSELHLRARALLKKLYPSQPVLEEVPIPGLGLFIDFYLPVLKTAVEVQGQQHSQFTPHFHGSRFEFEKSKQRDSMKRNWCDLNNVQLIELNYDGDDDEWERTING